MEHALGRFRFAHSTLLALGVVFSVEPTLALRAAAAPEAQRPNPTQGEWGAAIDGVRIRASAAKKTWRADEKPEITVDLSTARGGLALQNFPTSEVEVDGAWYVSRVEGIVGGWRVLSQAELVKRFAVARLDPKTWGLKSDSSRTLQLAAGKHAIRVSCRAGSLRPVSGPVEIEIAAESGA